MGISGSDLFDARTFGDPLATGPRYNCKSTGCVKTLGGRYLSQRDCEANCRRSELDDNLRLRYALPGYLDLPDLQSLRQIGISNSSLEAATVAEAQKRQDEKQEWKSKFQQLQDLTLRAYNPVLLPPLLTRLIELASKKHVDVWTNLGRASQIGHFDVDPGPGDFTLFPFLVVLEVIAFYYRRDLHEAAYYYDTNKRLLIQLATTIAQRPGFVEFYNTQMTEMTRLIFHGMLLRANDTAWLPSIMRAFVQTVDLTLLDPAPTTPKLLQVLQRWR